MAKLVLVTGGTRGIGKSICMMLKNSGYTVIANYAGNDEAAKSFSKITDIKSMKWDVSNYKICSDNINKICDEFGQPIDILVNNAGITADNMLHKSNNEDWLKVINTNLSSCYNTSRLVIEGMRKNKFGRIVNISSVNGLAGQLGQTNYAAAKAGIIGLTKSTALEGARYNITANAVAPGYVQTDMTSVLSQAAYDRIVTSIPVGRFATPEEIARAVLFLVADDAGFITGSVISVNGGQYM